MARKRRRTILLIILAVGGVLALALGLTAYLGYVKFREVSRSLRGQISSAMLGISPGEVIPREGRVIRELKREGVGFDLPFPIFLYPGARIQGVNISTFRNSSGDAVVAHALILMSTGDAEEEVIGYYMTHWRHFQPRHLKLKFSAIYPKAVAQTTCHGVSTEERQRVEASADIQSGPALRAMDDAVFFQYLMGKGGQQLAPGMQKVTEVMLWVPLHGR